MNKRHSITTILILLSLLPIPLARMFPFPASAEPFAQQSENVEFVGHIGGPTWAVAVQEDYVYISEGPRLTILDISDPASPTAVGKSPLFPGGVGDVYVAGRYAYVANQHAGLRVVDISDPSNPTEVGFYDVMWFANGVAIAGDYAYVADANGLQVVHILTSSNPTKVGFYDTPGFSADVAVVGDYAYVAAGSGGLRVVDISDPSNPTEVGACETPDWAEDVAVAGDYAYVADYNDGVLRVVDISDPFNPTEVGFCNTPINPTSVALGGNYAYVAAGNRGLRVVDISDPSNPTEVGFCNTAFPPMRVALGGNYAYVAAWSGGLRVMDVSDPSSPTEVAFYDVMWDPEDVAVAGGYAYIVDYNDDVLRVVDVLTPSNPTEVGACDTPGWARGVAVDGGHAYVADGWAGLRVVDVSTPSNPTEVGACDTPGYAVGVAVAANYAYVAEHPAWDGSQWVGGGLRIINVADPAAPTEAGFYDTPGYARDVAVAGNYAYVAAEYDGLRVINVTDPAAPSEAGFHDTAGYAQGVAVAGNYAYVADGYDGLRIINVSDPAAPTEAGFYDTQGDARGVAVAGNCAYVGAGAFGGLRVVDISDPSNPTEAGYYYTPGGAGDVAIAGGYAYVAADGLTILRYTGAGPTYSVTGHVRDGGGNPIPGVFVSAGASGSASTGASGAYTITNLITGTYTLKPSKSGWTFTPGTRTVSVPPSETGQDFIGSSSELPPTVTTLPASEPTLTSATLNGTVNPNGSDTRAWFEWGTDVNLSTFSSTPEQAVGAGTAPVTVTALLTGLQPGTPYYYRAAARNGAGTSQGAIQRLIILLGNNPTWRQNPYWNKYDRLIYKWAHQKNLPAPLLKAVIAHESGGLGSQSSLDRPALAFLYEPVTIDERYVTPGIRSGSLPGVRLADYVLPDNPPPPGEEPYNRFWGQFVSIPPGTTNLQMMSKDYPLSYGLTNPYGTPSEEFVAQYRLASSYGLGQVVYWWHHGLIGNDPPETLYDPETAIKTAATVLGKYRDRCTPGLTETTSDFAAWNPVLRAYNSGRCDGAPQYPNFVENYFPHCQPVLAGEDFDPDNLLSPRSLKELPSAPLTASQAALLPGQGPLDPDEYEVARLVADLKGTGQQQLAILYFVSPTPPDAETMVSVPGGLKIFSDSEGGALEWQSLLVTGTVGVGRVLTVTVPGGGSVPLVVTMWGAGVHGTWAYLFHWNGSTFEEVRPIGSDGSKLPGLFGDAGVQITPEGQVWTAARDGYRPLDLFDVSTYNWDGQTYQWLGQETISHATYHLFLPLIMKRVSVEACH